MESLNRHLRKENIYVSSEQKVYKKWPKGTKAHLVIDRVVMKNHKRHWKVIVHPWIDSKMSYDIVVGFRNFRHVQNNWGIVCSD